MGNKEWTVQTGNYRNIVVARTAKKAVVAAFKSRAPRNPGMLTRTRDKKDFPWFYLDTVHCLKLAGYRVQP